MMIYNVYFFRFEDEDILYEIEYDKDLETLYDFAEEVGTFPYPKHRQQNAQTLRDIIKRCMEEDAQFYDLITIPPNQCMSAKCTLHHLICSNDTVPNINCSY